MGVSYFLAVDVGTSRVGAATARLSADGSITATSFALGRKSDSVATVVFVTEDGDLLFGDAAERRGVTQPERLIREFKRSVGDEVPLVVGGRAIRAEQLYARTVASVIEMVTEREGAAPDGVALTHPAMWGAHRLGLVRAALDAVGVGEVTFITEPEAAARHYEAARTLQDGETLAVYDLGGGTFDSVILRKHGGSFEVVGEPVGLDNLGGADFDDDVLRHVLRAAEVPAESLEDASPDTRIALSQLRRECVDAKEALSFDSDVVIPVLLTAGRSSVRLTRAEFEDMIDGSLEQTIDALEDALDAADVDAQDLESILLIGGSSRIPLVTQRLSERLDRPTAIDADPKSSIALGAARTALVRTLDRDLGVSSELALWDDAAAAAELDLIPTAPASVLAAPIGPIAERSAPSVRHIMAISGGAIVVAAAIVFGSTMTAGSGLSAFFAPSASESTPTPTAEDETPVTEPDAAPDAAPVTAPVVAPEQQQTTPRSAPPRRSQKPVTKPKADAAPAPKPTKGAQTPPRPTADAGTGTPSTGTSTETTDTTDLDTTDPGTTDPDTTDPGTTDPGTTDPGTTDPGTTDPGTTDPGTTDPGTTDPGTTDPGTTDPGTTTDPAPDPPADPPPAEPDPAATPDPNTPT